MPRERAMTELLDEHWQEEADALGEEEEEEEDVEEDELVEVLVVAFFFDLLTP